MAGETMSAVKINHAFSLAENGSVEESQKMIERAFKYEPIFLYKEVHPEEEPDTDKINLDTINLYYDLSILNAELANSAESFNNLMSDTVLRLREIEKDIHKEEERIKDLNVLCNIYSGFDSVQTLTADDFEGDFTEEDGIFFSKVTDQESVPCIVENVLGNGYEGNDYVYKDKQFEKDSLDTSKRDAMTDNSVTTYYEYSRVNAPRMSGPVPAFINFDNKEAECTVTLRANAPINQLTIESNQKSIIIKEVAISQDGNVFTTVIDEPIAINQVDNKYNSNNYIYGSGLICFPDADFIKITFESSGFEDDVIAFKYKSYGSQGGAE